MTRLAALLFALFALGCTAEAGRDPVARETTAQVDAEPDSEPTEPSIEEPTPPTELPAPPTPEPVACEPATCDDDLTAVSFPYFTAPDCSAESMLIPLLPDDPAADWTLCDDDRAWVTGEQVSEPEALWSGSPGDCWQMPATPIGLEWWVAVEVTCPAVSD
jgi:hypothetical protein